MRKKEKEGLVVPYLREGGLVAYTTPAEIQADRHERHIRISEVLEEVASSATPSSVITEEMETALAAASIESIKPSKLARQRREAGTRKERARDRRPEVIVQPLEGEAEPPTPPQVEVPKSTSTRASTSTTPTTTEARPVESKPTRRTTKKTESEPTEARPVESKPTRRTTKKTDDAESHE